MSAKGPPACHPANQCFAAEIWKLKQKASKRGQVNMAKTYDKMLRSLSRAPDPIRSFIEAEGLENIGKFGAGVFDSVINKRRIAMAGTDEEAKAPFIIDQKDVDSWNKACVKKANAFFKKQQKTFKFHPDIKQPLTVKVKSCMILSAT